MVVTAAIAFLVDTAAMMGRTPIVVIQHVRLRTGRMLENVHRDELAPAQTREGREK